MLRRLFDWCAVQLARPRITAFFRLFGRWFNYSMVALVALVPVSWYFYLARRHEYVAFFLGPYTHTMAVLWAFISAVEAPVLLVFAAGVLVLAAVAVLGATIGVVVDAAILCLALIMLVVVPELGPLVMVLAVSTEPSPPGSYQVFQIKPDRKAGAEEALMHSITYANPAALDAIARFVADRGATRHLAAGA